MSSGDGYIGRCPLPQKIKVKLIIDRWRWQQTPDTRKGRRLAWTQSYWPEVHFRYIGCCCVVEKWTLCLWLNLISFRFHFLYYDVFSCQPDKISLNMESSYSSGDNGHFLHATAKSWKESISTGGWHWRLPTLSREWRNDLYFIFWRGKQCMRLEGSIYSHQWSNLAKNEVHILDFKWKSLLEWTKIYWPKNCASTLDFFAIRCKYQVNIWVVSAVTTKPTYTTQKKVGHSMAFAPFHNFPKDSLSEWGQKLNIWYALGPLNFAYTDNGMYIVHKRLYNPLHKCLFASWAFTFQ